MADAKSRTRVIKISRGYKSSTLENVLRADTKKDIEASFDDFRDMVEETTQQIGQVNARTVGGKVERYQIPTAGLKSLEPRPGSQINYFWVPWDPIVREAISLLSKYTPRREGKQARAYILYVDGAEKPLGGAIPRTAHEVAILNRMIYARRHETKWANAFPKVNNGVTERVAQEMQSRYPRQMINIYASFKDYFRGDLAGAKKDQFNRYPVIVIRAPASRLFRQTVGGRR